jgi:hypothetical protein
MISLSRLSFLMLCLCALAAAPLAAQETQQTEVPATHPDAPEAVPPPPLPLQKIPLDIPMEAFGTAHPECVEWSDACRTCAKDAENRVSCSTPGIACLPRDISCEKERK